MPLDPEHEQWLRSNEMCHAVTRAATDFLKHVLCGQLYGPPIDFPPLEEFRLRVQAAFERFNGPEHMVN